MSGVELLPCPHCAASSAGGVVRLLTHEVSPYDGSYSIVCDYSIGGCGASGGIRDHAGQAAVVWNRRDDSALSRRVAELEGALRDALGALDYFAEDDALAEDDGGVCDNLCGARVCDVIGCIRMKQNAARAALKGQG